MALNARFLTDAHPLLTDLRNGPRYVYNGQVGTLPWRTTYEQLARLPFVQQQGHHAFGWPVYALDVPLRLGALEVQGIEINTPDVNPWYRKRTDVPVDNYPFEVRLTEPGYEGYRQIRQYFGRALGKPERAWEYPNDQVNAEWTYDGLQIAVTYWFKKTVRRADWDYTSLDIRNHRIYSDYLTDAYTKQFDLGRSTVHWQTFAVPYVIVPHDYRVSRNVRFTPVALQRLLKQRQHTVAIWFDAQERRVGVGQSDYALILTLPDAPRVVLETIDAERGFRDDVLFLHGYPEGPQQLATASVGALNPVQKMLEQWLNP